MSNFKSFYTAILMSLIAALAACTARFNQGAFSGASEATAPSSAGTPQNSDGGITKSDASAASGQTLRSLANKRDFFIGALIGGAELKYQPPASGALSTQSVFTSQFNMINDSGLKFSYVEPRAPKFVNGNLVPSVDPEADFTFGTTPEDIAAANGMKVHGHTLLYNLAEPTWLTGCAVMGENPLNCTTPYNASELQQILKYHIQTTLNYYKNKYPGLFVTWDVANEIAYGADYSSRHSVFEKITDPATGQNSYTYYLKLAFQYAQQADPSMHFCLNDNTFENVDGARAKRVFEFVRTLKSEGVPISCVGYEMHKSLPTDTSVFSMATEDELLKSMQRFSDIGVQVYITEMDVGIPVVNKLPPAGTAPPAPSTENPTYWNAQAAAYAAAISACLSSLNCEGLILWDLNPIYNWEGTSSGLSLYGLSGGFGGDATVFDVNNSPKPAFTAIQQALANAVTAAQIVGGSGTSSAGLKITVTAEQPSVDLHVIAAAVNANKGWPTLNVTVDGKVVSSLRISSKYVYDYPLALALAPGSHSVALALTAESVSLGETAAISKIWTQASAVSFQTLLGNLFSSPTSGSFSVDAVNGNGNQIHLKSNTGVEQTVTIPFAGNYELTLSAQAVLYQNVGATAEIKIDGRQVTVFQVNAVSAPQDYFVVTSLSAGSHVFEIDFTNAVSGGGRELSIDHLSIESVASESVSVKYSGMNLSCTSCITGDRMVANSSYFANVRAPSSATYKLNVTAASHETSAGGGSAAFGEATVLVDGVAKGTFTASSDAWATYTVAAPLTAGNHLIQIEFTNAASASPGGFFLNRNLLVDGLNLQP